MSKLDKLDRQIISIISNNARIPFKDVAEICNVSRASVHQRVQRLIDDQVITGSGYIVNPKYLGYLTCTYVGIKLSRGSYYESVTASLKRIPEVVECHCTTGPYALLVKLYVRDNEQLFSVLNKQMQSIEGVETTETMISLEEVFRKPLPINLDD